MGISASCIMRSYLLCDEVLVTLSLAIDDLISENYKPNKTRIYLNNLHTCYTKLTSITVYSQY